MTTNYAIPAFCCSAGNFTSSSGCSSLNFLKADSINQIWETKFFVSRGSLKFHDHLPESVAYPGILFGGGVSTNSVEDRGQREQGSGGGSPLVRGSGGSCNFVQEISFHIVKFS